MLRVISRGGKAAESAGDTAAIWFDLDDPTEAEEAAVEAVLGIDVPTESERAAFEESARYYEEDGALFLTATLLGRRDEGMFISGAVTFVLARAKLVTLRKIRPRAFEVGQGRASARIGSAMSGAEVFTALLEGAIERIADVIAEAARDATTLSSAVFADAGPGPNLRASLRMLGRVGAITAMAHDSLSSLQRLFAFADHICERHALDPTRFSILQRDAAELERVAEALQSRLSFLQDAVLGLVNATQTDVLKALSLATMAFVPPTLIASVFGMNFIHMTWVREPWGPWIAFALMAVAPATLFAIAKWRRWF